MPEISTAEEPAIALRRVETDDDIAAVFRLVATIWPVCYRGIIADEQIRYMLATMYAPETIRRDTASITSTQEGICEITASRKLDSEPSSAL